MRADAWKEIARELNSIAQLSRDSANSEKIARRVERVRRLIRPEGEREPRAIQTGTRRFKLWLCSPFCFWCGCVTRIEGVYESDAATLDHLRHKGERAKSGTFPDAVLACRRCNNKRGQPKAASTNECPVIERTARLT